MSGEAQTVLDLVRAGRVRVADRGRPARRSTPAAPTVTPAPLPLESHRESSTSPAPEPAPSSTSGGGLDPLLGRVVAGMQPTGVSPRSSSPAPEPARPELEAEPEPAPTQAPTWSPSSWAWWRPLLLVAGVATAGVLAVRLSGSSSSSAAPAETPASDGWDGGASDGYDVPTVTV